MAKFCVKCGTQLNDDAAFCNVCGTPVSPVPQQGNPVPQAAPSGMPQQGNPVPQGGMPTQGAVPQNSMQPQGGYVSPQPGMQPQQGQMPQGNYGMPQGQMPQGNYGAPGPVPPNNYGAPGAVPPGNYGAPQGQKKGHAGLIIGICSALIVVALLTFLAVGVFDFLHLKDKKEEPVVEEVVKEEPKEEPKEEEVEEEPEEEEEVAEEPAPVPFFEENGFTNIDETDLYDGVVLPIGIQFTDEEGNLIEYDDRLEVIEGDATCKFDEIAVTEPDEEGYVTYKVSYEIDRSPVIRVKEWQDFWNDYTQVSNMSPFSRMFRFYDYYSGKVIELPNETQGTECVSTTLEWNGEKTDVQVWHIDEWIHYEDEWESKNDEDNEKDAIYSLSEQYRESYLLRVPKDYDGLVLMNIKENNLSEKSSPDDKWDFDIKGPDFYGRTYEPGDVYLFRVSDNVKRTDKCDYLTENGIIISKTGLDNSFITSESKDGEDVDEINVPYNVYTAETTDNMPDGYKKVTAMVVYDMSNQQKGYEQRIWIEGFDRYNGYSFESGTEFTSGNSGNSESVDKIMIPVGDKEYDVSISYTYTDKKDGEWICEASVTCPVDYDGTVFRVGYGSAELFGKLGEIGDLSKKLYRLDEMPYFNNGHKYYYYTVSGQ